MFADDLEDMLPLPRARFDAVEWVERRADREGNVEIDSNRYLAGPSWRGWTLQVGLRAFDVEIRTRRQEGEHAAPRVWQVRENRQEPGLPAARAGQEAPRVGREPHTRGLPRQAPAAHRRDGLRGIGTRSV